MVPNMVKNYYYTHCRAKEEEEEKKNYVQFEFKKLMNLVWPRLFYQIAWDQY